MKKIKFNAILKTVLATVFILAVLFFKFNFSGIINSENEVLLSKFKQIEKTSDKKSVSVNENKDSEDDVFDVEEDEYEDIDFEFVSNSFISLYNLLSEHKQTILVSDFQSIGSYKIPLYVLFCTLKLHFIF